MCGWVADNTFFSTYKMPEVETCCARGVWCEGWWSWWWFLLSFYWFTVDSFWWPVCNACVHTITCCKESDKGEDNSTRSRQQAADWLQALWLCSKGLFEYTWLYCVPTLVLKIVMTSHFLCVLFVKYLHICQCCCSE